jgi:arginyl-tRNA synthetase
MAVSSNPCASAVAHAVAKLLDISPENVKVDPPPRPDLGDYAVPAFTLLKGSKEAPADLALRIARSLPTDDYIASATATGPFVNVRINRSRAFRDLAASVATPEVLIPRRGEGEIVCIDYSSPNISKHLAYHHIRSTMIGHSLVKLHQAMGYQVVRINHLGDWGTTHGMLLAADAKWGHEYAGYPQLGVTELNDLYVRFREAMKSDPSLEAMGRAWFKRLEDGDPAVRARWQQFRETSWREFDRVYKMLDVEFDDLRGESFYEDKMPEILELLSRRDLLKESEGALVVHIPGEKTPMLIKTKDGTTLYATRDLAAALFRWRQYKFSRCLYVVDRGQSLHFRQLFACLKLLGFEWADRCLHVPFGADRRRRRGGVRERAAPARSRRRLRLGQGGLDRRRLRPVPALHPGAVLEHRAQGRRGGRRRGRARAPDPRRRVGGGPSAPRLRRSRRARRRRV